MLSELFLLAQLLDLSRDCLYAMDENGKIIHANKASYSTYRYDSTELIGKNIRELTAEDSVPLISGQIARLLEHGEIGFETMHCRKDLSLFPVEVDAHVVSDSDSKVIICMTRDMTERKLAEKVLSRSEERFQTILEDMDNGYFELDPQGYCVFVNDAMCKVLGISRTEIVAKHFGSFIDPADDRFGQNSQALIDDVIQRDVTLSGLFGTIVKGDGSRRIIGVSVSPIKDTAGSITGVRGITRDITDRRKMEQQLLIASKLAAIGELAAGVAHEINNPLMAIMGYAQLLSMDNEVPARIKSDLDNIYSQSQRAARIIQNLIMFSQSYEAEKKIIDINDLISRILDMRSYEHNLGNIHVTTDFQKELPGILANSNQLQQVILNIIVNAEQSIASKCQSGNIRITSRLLDDHVQMSINDDGAGIPREVLDKLFDPFFTTKDIGQGTGLGLSVCHGIVTKHGGRIYAESVVGDGATFIIELPVAKASEHKTPAAPEKLQKVDTGSDKSKKVLIVDDEKVIRDILCRILAERGFQVDSAASGAEGLEKIQNCQYEAYLLDIKMPGVDGMDIYQIIGSKYPEMVSRMIFITGDTISSTTLNFLESTGREYFSKPLDFSKLIAAIEELTALA